MKPKKDEATKASEPEKVDAYMQKTSHPMKDVLQLIREIILSTDPEIGEEIKWNSPTFFYAGAMQPSDPKLYKRYLIVSNLFKQDCIRLVFPSGARVNDMSGLLTGDYADGRRLAMFYSIADVEAKKANLQAVIKRWLELMEK